MNKEQISIAIQNNNILSNNFSFNNIFNNEIYLSIVIVVLFILIKPVFSRSKDIFKIIGYVYKFLKKYMNRERIKAQIIDIDVYRNVFEVSVEVQNNGRSDLSLRFINDRNNFKPNVKKEIIANFYDNSPFYKANSVEKYMKFNKSIFKYCIYMRKLEELNKWLYEIIIPPKDKVTLFLLIGRDENKQENLKSINQNTSLEFRTENETKCVAKWNKQKCKEWMKKQENI